MKEWTQPYRNKMDYKKRINDCANKLESLREIDKFLKIQLLIKKGQSESWRNRHSE